MRQMKFDSKYFDCVRVKPDHAKVVGPEAPVCQWKACSSAGPYRAPGPSRAAPHPALGFHSRTAPYRASGLAPRA